MIYLIKLIFFLLICCNSNATENLGSQIIFKLNNNFFTNVDLENRTEYIAQINKLDSSQFNEIDKKEIQDDYISSLIFNEYYIENKIFYKNLKSEIDSIFIKSIINPNEINEEEIKSFKFNIRIDLIRKKIIEGNLNAKKNSLLEEASRIDLIYNYNTKYIIIKSSLSNLELVEKVNNRNDFNNLKIILEENRIDFFYKEEDINNNNIISKKIKKLIDGDLPIYVNNKNGYINIISIDKNLESFEGIFVKLVNFTSNKPIDKNDLQCDQINKSTDNEKTFYKDY